MCFSQLSICSYFLDQEEEILVKEKGGYVMLGSERPTPTSSVGSGSAKGDHEILRRYVIV